MMILIFGGLCRDRRDRIGEPQLALPRASAILIDPKARREGNVKVDQDVTGNLRGFLEWKLGRRRHKAVWIESRRQLLIVGGTAEDMDGRAHGAPEPERAIVWDAGLPGELRPVGALREPRTMHELVALPDGRVLVIGGEALDGHRTRLVEVFLPGDGGIGAPTVLDPDSESFFPYCAPLPAPRANFGAALLESGAEPGVYVTGGGDGPAILRLEPGGGDR
jgi:hypothetical protein